MTTIRFRDIILPECIYRQFNTPISSTPEHRHGVLLCFWVIHCNSHGVGGAPSIEHVAKSIVPPTDGEHETWDCVKKTISPQSSSTSRKQVRGFKGVQLDV